MKKICIASISLVGLGLLASIGPAWAQQGTECKLPAEKQLKVTSTATWECGVGTGDPGCSQVPVLVSGTGVNCVALLPYATLKVIKRGTNGLVTWKLSDSSGNYAFDPVKGIDIANPAPYYHSPGRETGKWKFHWHTNGKKNPEGSLHHCPVVYYKGVLCAAQDPVIVNVE